MNYALHQTEESSAFHFSPNKRGLWIAVCCLNVHITLRLSSNRQIQTDVLQVSNTIFYFPFQPSLLFCPFLSQSDFFFFFFFYTFSSSLSNPGWGNKEGNITEWEMKRMFSLPFLPSLPHYSVVSTTTRRWWRSCWTEEPASTLRTTNCGRHCTPRPHVATQDWSRSSLHSKTCRHASCRASCWDL